MTARKTGGLVKPYKGMVLAAPKSAGPCPFKLFDPSYLQLTLLLTPEGVFQFFHTYFVDYFI